MSRLRGILWLHLTRIKRYALSLFSNAITDALWALIPLAGTLMLRGESLAAEIFWAVVAWMIIANSAWLIGGWVEYAAFLGVLEYHLHAGVSPLALAAGRAVTLLASVTVSSTIVLITLLLLGLTPSAADPWGLLVSLVFVLLQSISYGLVLSAVSLRIGVPSALLDIASLAQLGLLLLPVSTESIGALSLVPLLGPAYLARYCVHSQAAPFVLGRVAVVTLALLLVAVLASRWSSAVVARRGLRAVGLV